MLIECNSWKKMFFVFVLISVLTTHNVYGLKITGPKTNITAVLWRAAMMGAGLLPNFLPDLKFNDNTRHRKPGADAYRKHLLRYISVLEKKLVDDSKEFTSDDFTDYDEVALKKPIKVGPLGEAALRSLNKKFEEIKQEHKERARVAIVHELHEKRMKEVKDFMEDHYLTTSYLHSEVKRIQRSHLVKDPLREMVEYVEDPARGRLKEALLNCFEKLKRPSKLQIDMWSKHKTNNLVINTFKDPYNYGIIN